MRGQVIILVNPLCSRVLRAFTFQRSNAITHVVASGMGFPFSGPILSPLMDSSNA